MNRLGNKVFSSVLACLVAVSLAACGGRHSSQGALPSAIQSPGTTVPSDKLETATFTFKIPAPSATSSKVRRPAYISAATKSIRINMTANTAGVAITSQFNVVTAVTNASGNAPGAPCTGSGPWTCTIAVQVPPGDDTFTFTAYDNSTGTGNILSQQIQTLTLVKGKANAFTVTFDANAAAISLSGTQACTAGSIQGVFGSVGTTPVTLTVSFTDAASKTIINPGIPIISIQNNHSGDTTFKTTSGTIDGTGGNATFSINQSTQSFTLTPSAVPLSNVSVVVHGTAANSTGSSDGLAFTAAHTFTFSAGTAPPTHNFLGVIEQSGAPNTGQINFYNVSLGGVGGPDSISAFSTPTLTTTNSISSPSQPDVNNPLDMVWDSGGNLLIANGGQGGAVTAYAPSGDYGNFACVPAGAITTGANLATTDSTNLHVPAAIALSSNGTVALANNPGNAATKVEEFTLNTNYTPGSSLPDPGGNFGVPLGRPLVNLPTLTAGTFAVGLYNGTNSKLDILGPTGTVSTVTDGTDSELKDPFGMAWDATNNQLIISDNSGCNPPAATNSSHIEFYTVANPPTGPTKVGSFLPQSNPNGGNPYSAMIPQRIAASPNGTLAVAGINCDHTSSGLPEVQIYSSNAVPASRVAAGTIPFDTLIGTDPGCSDFTSADYTYGNSVTITDLKWLSDTKLLILLQTPNNTARQGIYIYDVSASTFTAPGGNWCGGLTPPNGPKQTSFTNLTTLAPHSAAFKP